MMLACLILILFLAAFPYVFYPIAIRLWGVFKQQSSLLTDGQVKKLSITVYFSALNEEGKVYQRLENVFAISCPCDIEAIVVSDGSDDDTVEEIKRFQNDHQHLNVRCVELSQNCGQANAQNLVAKIADNEILISTDAETVFNNNFYDRILQRFTENVGVVSGNIDFGSSSRSRGLVFKIYFRFEAWLRKWEAQVGYGVKVSGPCVAYRRSLWVNDIEAFEDVDQMLPILASAQGYVTKQADDAWVVDLCNEGFAKDLKARSRMTRKALLTTFKYLSMGNFIKQPVFWLCLLSHKIMRFFTPVLVAVSLPISLYYFIQFVPMYWVLVILAAFSMTALIPFSRNIIVMFFAGMLGHVLGIWGWLRGNRSGTYTPTNSQ